ncbi:MAG TPA: ParB/RepB/Spo0J family partition protein [Mycobacteriales bacterium]|nr:ParB/RepB/Spo0J family partition protein [Mycobacteriales bacterium]
MDTGFSAADSRDDFARARRNATLSRLAARLRLRSGDLDVLLPFDEVVTALGRRGETRLGRKMVDLDHIVGSTDRVTGFDRRFRPTSDLARQRFERLAKAVRRGEDLPPVDLLQVGDVYFVQDGHHRVAVMRALGRERIEARVTKVHTALGAGADLRLVDLPLKGHERLFQERVPLPRALAPRVALDDPEDYAVLAEGVEAWGMRWMQERGEFADRPAVALAWFTEEYEPVLAALREAGLHPGDGQLDAQVYLRLARERYLVLRTHRWDDDVLERLRLHAQEH